MTAMPTFLDTHLLQPFTAEELNNLQKELRDEFGVTNHDVLYREEDDKICCVLEAPNAEAVHNIMPSRASSETLSVT